MTDILKMSRFRIAYVETVRLQEFGLASLIIWCYRLYTRNFVNEKFIMSNLKL